MVAQRPEPWRVQALLDSTPFEELPGTLELTTRQAAPYCGVRPETLDKYRKSGKGPAYVTYGDGPRARVFYTIADIREWTSRYQGVRRTPGKNESEETATRVA